MHTSKEGFISTRGIELKFKPTSYTIVEGITNPEFADLSVFKKSPSERKRLKTLKRSYEELSHTVQR